MGHGASTDARLKAVVSKLTKLELKDIENVFNELSTTTDDGTLVIKQPSWLNRDKFAEVFGLNELVIEQLFLAFDRDQDGSIDMQEFVTGMALCLHGGIREKCVLLFKIFNLDDDDGITHEELSTVLTSCLMSANIILQSVLKSEGLLQQDGQVEDERSKAVMVNVVVDKIVKNAFATCDTSKNGRLELDEFANWVMKNPKLMNNIFVTEVPKLNKNPPESNMTLLQMSQDVTSQESFETSTSIGDLFKDSTSEPNFFDTLGSNNSASPSANESVDSSPLPRPSSELFLPATGVGDQDIALQHSQSQGDLSVISKDTKNRLIGEHVLQATGSMQSITLSQDSIDLEEDENVRYSENYDTPPHITEVVDVEHQVDVSVTNAEQSNEGFIPSSETTTEALATATQNVITDVGTDVQSTTNNPAYHAGFESDKKQRHPLETTPSVDNNTPNEGGGTQDHPTSFVNPVMSYEQRTHVTEKNSSVVTVADDVLENTLQEAEQTHKKKRGFSFWQPNSEIASLLEHVQQGGVLENSFLTFPSVLVETVSGDPVKDLVRKYLGEQEASKRPTHNLSHIEMNENGLRTLLAAGCWRTAMGFTTEYLTKHGQGLVNTNVIRSRLTPSVLQVWFVRITLLVKLRMFSSAEAELNAFHDFEAPDLYYQFYPDLYPGKKGSIVPFSLRLLHAKIPQHNGRPHVSLDRLYMLLDKVEDVLENLSNGYTEDGSEQAATSQEETKATTDLWKMRKIHLTYAIGNCFFTMKEYTLSVNLFEECIKLEPDRKNFINSGIGRVYLQLGDLKSAQKYFDMVERDVDNVKDKKLMNNVIAMNSGYMKLSMSFYAESYKHFSYAMTEDPDNFAAYNNAAVCLLFLGKVKEASNILETMVWRSPERSLHEDTLFNITTVYELETSRSIQKKYKLLDLVCQHKGDGFSTQCLKLS